MLTCLAVLTCLLCSPACCARAGICIICREDMAPEGRNKRLPCSHVFHLHCLRCAARIPLHAC
jgi:hypothetical protein